MQATTHQPRATCAHCASRPATTVDDYGGRLVPSCLACKTEDAPPPPPAPRTRERVLRMIRVSPGLDVGELAAALGEDDELGRARISAALTRACKSGQARGIGPHNERLYYPADKARRRAAS